MLSIDIHLAHLATFVLIHSLFLKSIKTDLHMLRVCYVCTRISLEDVCTSLSRIEIFFP